MSTTSRIGVNARDAGVDTGFRFLNVRPAGSLSAPMVPTFFKTWLTLLACSGFLLSGCQTSRDIFTLDEVKAWERGSLARDDMQLVNDPLDQRVDEHIYFSKEASTGGVSAQGGGCGCN